MNVTLSRKLIKTVLLLKTQTNEQSTDKYEQQLLENGFTVIQVKTLVFEFKNVDILAQKLKQVNSYSGVIFSSPRCVQAVNLACQNQGVDIKLWQSKKNFSVGKTTSTVAFDKLGLECLGQDSGNAVNLLKYILEGEQYYPQPFLYPHGNLKSDTFSSEEGKLNIDGILVYDTIDNPKIEEEIKLATNDFTEIPEFIVFFSPSGLHSSLKYLNKTSNFSSSKLIAIGPTTELAMKNAKLTVFGVAKQPTPQSLLDVILSE